MSDVTLDSLTIRNRLARIDQMLADHDRTHLEVGMVSWQVGATMLGGAAVFFAAGAAFAKLIGG